MKSILFSIGPFHVYGYGLMIAIGVISAIYVTEYRAGRHGLVKDAIFPLGITVAIGGILGAKLLYLILELPDIIKNPKLLLDVANGFVVYGGIIGGILTGLVYTLIKRMNFLQYFDIVMPQIALAQGFGRIGCLLAGCCYGRETTGPFHIVFTESALAPNHVWLIPTQIISSALNFLHFIVLVLLARKLKKPGQIAGCYLVFYSIGRYIVELFRGDLERGSVGAFSTSQFISLFIVLIGIALFVLSTKFGKIPRTIED